MVSNVDSMLAKEAHYLPIEIKAKSIVRKVKTSVKFCIRGSKYYVIRLNKKAFQAVRTYAKRPFNHASAFFQQKSRCEITHITPQNLKPVIAAISTKIHNQGHIFTPEYARKMRPVIESACHQEKFEENLNNLAQEAYKDCEVKVTRDTISKPLFLQQYKIHGYIGHYPSNIEGKNYSIAVNDIVNRMYAKRYFSDVEKRTIYVQIVQKIGRNDTGFTDNMRKSGLSDDAIASIQYGQVTPRIVENKQIAAWGFLNKTKIVTTVYGHNDREDLIQIGRKNQEFEVHRYDIKTLTDENLDDQVRKWARLNKSILAESSELSYKKGISNEEVQERIFKAAQRHKVELPDYQVYCMNDADGFKDSDQQLNLIAEQIVCKHPDLFHQPLEQQISNISDFMHGEINPAQEVLCPVVEAGYKTSMDVLMTNDTIAHQKILKEIIKDSNLIE